MTEKEQVRQIVEKYNMSMGHLNENATAKEFKIVLKYVADQANFRQRKLVGLEEDRKSVV